MDHLLFLIQERADSTLLMFHSAGRHLGSQFSNGFLSVKDGIKTVLQNSFTVIKNHRFSEEVANKIWYWLARVRELLTSIRPSVIYEKISVFLVTEVTYTHIYFGGAGFFLGIIFGTMMGTRLQNSILAPQYMRAIIINSYNGIEAIGVVEDVFAPRIVEPYQVLVQVKAAAIDYFDIRVAEGYGRALRKHLNKYNPNTGGEFPVVLGRDCAGIVVAIGRDVTRVEQGEEVWLAVPFYHPGTLSEYVVVSEEFVASKPSQLSFEKAAALPYSVMTAWDALVTQGGLGPETTAGKRVLVHAGVSGVGAVAIQLVQAWGGSVTTTVSSHAAPVASMLGAKDIITYDNCNFEKELMLRQKFDVILNTVGQVLHESCLKYCLPGGIVVTTASSQLPSDSYGCITGGLYSLFLRARYWFTKAPWLIGGWWSSLEVKGEVLERILPLIISGQLQAVVDKVYSAQDAEVAFTHIAKGEQIGRTVIRFRARPVVAHI